ncbi:MAG: alpha-mannosidase [Clostridia bacterium]|nr:alpha-mannosidase [Clostridia bacterium]
MYNERLKERVFRKLERTLTIYNDLVYEKVGEIENPQSFSTTEHLRSVPGSGFAPIERGTRWGGEWVNCWIKGGFTVPENCDGKAVYALSLCGGREQLFFVNGVPKGIYNSKNGDIIGGNHNCQYMGKFRAGEKVELAFECYAGHFDVDTDPYNNYNYPDIPAGDYSHTFDGVNICTRNEDIFTLVIDIRELLSAATSLPETDFARPRARNALEKIADTLVLDPKHASAEAVKKGVEDSLAVSRAYFHGGNSRIFGRVGVTGHSHMDTAWLWPVSETVRKCARTYANALSLMDQYPEYTFMQSSALHGEWMKNYYPTIFEDMKKRVAEGRYEPNGGVYVECDCNITSGELMVRQFLKGQQFTRENFGYTSDAFWLPDTFGYNGNIPQIMRGSEVKYFCTTKIGWNELNRFPFESFVWKGIDGSEVLTHFMRIHAWPDVRDCRASINDISLKDTTDMRLIAYGYGDGGGGPTASMIESYRRSSNMEGMPEIEEMTVSGFMRELEKQKENLPVYKDELYLELHRGTLTQMHDVKRKNRKAEYALHNMEFLNVLSGEKRNENSDKWLKILLKNQFHDILPGTSISPVYDLYNEELDELLENYGETALGYARSLTQGSDRVTLFNTLSFDRNDVSFIEAQGYAKDYPSQRYTDICGRDLLAVGNTHLPAFGSKSIALTEEKSEAASPFEYDGVHLATPYYEIVFDENGYISSLIDKKSGRQLRKENGAPLNVLLFGEDLPLEYDNWDIERDIIKNLRPVCGFKGREVAADGAVMIVLRSEFTVGDGTSLKQDMICYADSPRIDFHTLVDWQSPHRLLKAGFDLDISAPKARCEIQFGAIERPTTENNSLEVAKFEVCNRNFTDLSEPSFGAAILNDCKYGISLADCNLRLSLHRGGNHPTVNADAGVHEMTYSLLVHGGGFTAENVVLPAYELNVPAVCVKGSADIDSFAKTDKQNIIIDTVKPAEDDSNAFVLRLYECEGTKTNSNVTLPADAVRAVLTNMLEDEREDIPCENGILNLTFRPFEIKTVKIYR